MKQKNRVVSAAVSAAVGVVLLASGGLLAASRAARSAQSSGVVWIEGEALGGGNLPAPSESSGVKVGGWNKPEFLSDGKWLHVSVDADKIEKTVPTEGFTISYPFSLSTGGARVIWNRVGYEFVRSPFEWRIDSGAWASVSPDELTTDLVPLADWNEVAWLKMGKADLSAGNHTLQIRLSRTLDGSPQNKGKPARLLYASDALAISPETGPDAFVPNGKFAPGKAVRTPRDEAAASKVFEIKPSQNAARASVSLAGDWEICRADEALPPFDIATPVSLDALPKNPNWTAIAVPSDKTVSRPDLTFAHRVFYRTRVNVAEGMAGRGAFLTFPRNNLNTTVYVNGKLCGFEKNPNVRFDMDISAGLKTGVNEILVAIRDPWYAYTGNPKDPMKRRRKFNLPISVVKTGFQDLSYPVWNAWECGIVQTPTLTIAGTANYIVDVFVQPRVDTATASANRLVADVTVVNPSELPGSTGVGFDIVDSRTGATVESVKAAEWLIFAKGEARKTVRLSAAWPGGKPWWPEPGPQLYRLRTHLWNDFGSGRPMPVPTDERFDTFGFREWGSRGKDFTLNGIVWHGWADLNAGSTPDAALKNYRATNQRFLRLSGYAQGGPTWNGLTPSEALDFFDKNGVVARRSGDLDGEAIGYMAIENDPDLRALYGGSQIKKDLMRHWKDQMVAQVKAERNHPSVHVWSLENEWLYINCINLYGGLMDEFEAAVKEVGDAVFAVDPTRLWMTDGGGAGKANLFPIHGDHYVFSESDGRFPDIAYETNPNGGGRGRWTWDQKRPRYAGEDYFATGINPADYAMIGGEANFNGKSEARATAGKIQRILTEGYRWAEFGAFHFWLGSETALDQYGSNADIAAFAREHDSAFSSGQKVTRTVRVFNDSFHVDGPFTLGWTVVMSNGKAAASGSQTLIVPRGEAKTTTVSFTLPTVATRTDARLLLRVIENGKLHFTDGKPLSILPSPTVATAPRARAVGAARTNLSLVVYDPNGETGAALRSLGRAFTTVSSLDALDAARAGKSVIVIGRDALTEKEATSPRLSSWAASGAKIIVLEQTNPLKFQGLPTPIESTDAGGRVAFLEDATHPALVGLRDSDFFTWRPNAPVYTKAYAKPERGARSLIQCDSRLGKSALIEAPVGPGLLLLCQLSVAKNAATVAPARVLLANLIDHARSYKQTFRPAFAALSGASPEVAKALDATGLRYQTVAGPLAALKPGAIALVAATPANLKLLADNPAALARFTKSGGWLTLFGLTPDGLASYNKLVGVEHLIRPFRREKVGLAVPRPPLAAGLSAGDTTQLSGKRIFGWVADEFLSDETFTYVVDSGGDIARFGKLPGPEYFGYGDSGNDHNPLNIYDGLTATDGWVFTFSLWAGSGPPKVIPLTFDRPKTFAELTWQSADAYYRPTKIAVSVDGGKDRTEHSLAPNNTPQTIALNPPKTGAKLEVQIVAWDAAKEPAIVGIEDLKVKVARPADFLSKVRPLTDVGGLVSYPRGGGGIVLCNLNFKAGEAVPINGVKKRALLSGVLRNLNAPFSGGATIVAGASGLRYESVDIGPKATAFRNERGWFGDSKKTLAGLQSGRQIFAGVPFTLFEFPTSPVPNAVVLGGPNVPNNPPDSVRGIVVNKKADALFFLQTARVDRRRDDRERREKKSIVVAQYVVTYADGEKAIVPIRLEDDIDDFRQRAPAGLPGASLAWSRPFESDPGESATAWIFAWTNPKPQKEIATIDLEYVGERRAIPALLAITTARASSAAAKAP